MVKNLNIFTWKKYLYGTEIIEQVRIGFILNLWLIKRYIDTITQLDSM